MLWRVDLPNLDGRRPPPGVSAWASELTRLSPGAIIKLWSTQWGNIRNKYLCEIRDKLLDGEVTAIVGIDRFSWVEVAVGLRPPELETMDAWVSEPLAIDLVQKSLKKIVHSPSASITELFTHFNWLVPNGEQGVSGVYNLSELEPISNYPWTQRPDWSHWVGSHVFYRTPAGDMAIVGPNEATAWLIQSRRELIEISREFDGFLEQFSSAFKRNAFLDIIGDDE